MTLPRTTAVAWLVLLAASLALGEPRAGVASKEGRQATPAVVNPAVRSPVRPTLSLDGPWDFATDPKLQGEARQWYRPGKPLPSPRQIQVPGCWEAQGVGEPGLSNADNKLIYEPVNVKLRAAYTGAAWYKKTFTVPPEWAGRQIWLKLGGVNAQGWVWVNGKYVAHNWAYCGTWKYNVTDLVSPGRQATVAVLARNDVAGRRGESNCLRMYGGLFRSVELDATPAVLIDNAYAEPLLDQKKVRLHVTLRNTADTAPAEPLRVRAEVTTVSGAKPAGQAARSVVLDEKGDKSNLPRSGPEGASHKLDLSPCSGPTTELTLEIGLDPLEPWSPESPFLYKAEIVLEQGGKPIDGWAERFGVKKYEVRGGDLYLNNARYFLRGCGDDHVYPITVCSPASREAHAKHLRIAKQYGFNYVRHHTHCEIPEYYEAADEVGIMVQPELPYYGTFSERRPYAHLSGAPLMAKDDLVELVAHYRRYTSLATYVGGNEGYCPSPLDRELYALAKKLDPSRPWVSMDGGRNTRENSDVNNCWGFGAQVHPPMKENVWPHVLHEYMSLGINEDPRLEAKYTGAFAPNKTLKEVRASVAEEVGLEWKWAEACFDAGHRLQGIWHRMGIESARIDPYLDGFSCWLMVDISPSSQNGVLNMFWEPKKSLPEDFRQFNAPTVILARTTDRTPGEPLCLNPAAMIHTGGDAFDLDWVVSHFQPTPIAGATLAWRVEAAGETLAGGKIEHVDVPAGSVPVVGRSRITLPEVPKALKATLVAELEREKGDKSNLPRSGPEGASHKLDLSPFSGRERLWAKNSWNLWIFPKFRPQPEGGKGLAATAGLMKLLGKRYPGVVRLGTAEAAGARLVVARGLIEPGVVEALDEGKSVVCLSLPGYDTLRPGVRLGWWQVTNQTGTAIAAHPALGDFPHDGYLDQGWFRLVDRAEKLDPGHKFRAVEPIIVGIGRATGYRYGTLGYPLGFNLYAFQARVGRGKLLSAGLKLDGDNPEAVHLLDQFLRYAGSERFDPQGTLDLAELRQQIKTLKELNGWSETVKASETTEWHSFLRTGTMHVVRQLKQPGSVAWKTGRWTPDEHGTVRFRWIANLGWRTQPAGGKFTLYLGDEKLMDFDITLKSAEWKSPDGKAVLRYTVKSLDRDEDSSGIMELALPAAKLPPGGGPVSLRVEGSGPDSRRYFGLQEWP